MVWIGLLALALCLLLAVQPDTANPRIDSSACDTLVMQNEKPAGSGFRIVRFGPGRVELDGGVCVVVAGIVDEEAAPRIEGEGEGEGEGEEGEVDTSPVELVFYLNNAQWETRVMAQRKPEPQWLFLPLDVPASAADDATGFWPKLLGSLVWRSSGVRHVQLGVSRKDVAADTPEFTTAKLSPWSRVEIVEDGARVVEWKAPEPVTKGDPSGGFELRVFSRGAVAAGFVALALFSAATVAAAARTPLLRDNALRLRDIYPERLRAAQAAKRKKKAELKKAVAPDAKAAAQKALREASEEERRVEAVLDSISPELRAAEAARARAKAAGDPALAAADEAVKAARKRFGGRAVGSYSLARTQMAFWLFLITAGYVFIALSIGQYLGIVNDKIVALLGISAGTGLGAVMLGREAYGETLTEGYLRDVLCIEGSPQLTRIQAFGWTLVLGAIFVWLALGEYRFAEFDTMLLVLMGLSTGLYVTFKPGEIAREESGTPVP
ncbi:hypothetical protein [Amaricoccus sp.]|uniref:hypothetical protein n=1 Tax=Amaricoccus sp. TaxID=1872485 RepID=UPI001B462F8B|nr:hypothetical protein [Amaricoccus sp.]MBP7000178.1 hypothetical protein [Amaricoccus sp.]